MSRISKSRAFIALAFWLFVVVVDIDNPLCFRGCDGHRHSICGQATSPCLESRTAALRTAILCHGLHPVHLGHEARRPAVESEHGGRRGVHHTGYHQRRRTGCRCAPSTVFRAFSRPGLVSVKTSERIFQVARELGYRQDEVPRVPASRTHHQGWHRGLRHMEGPPNLGRHRLQRPHCHRIHEASDGLW